ncbi:hypothetical protein LTR20_009317 [Exophiala xenobiotica]|nr:hypothetical protein LTR41_000775 [Exophiala xenobiotica]KAK5278923.1 hypothetical protein LTR40_008511 [Exophiala xenobiotica]KAK5361737.1 hypothetical protein LTS13_009738 [Exophiala xenobiotica]KAK5456376.1 hypothetical protein LTR20_009317 [Exophiala xenobiotica]KAK5472278.1 hypothetical protein LTR26_010404 [Exophiala xenobiotica]
MADEATKQKLRSTFDKLTPEDFASVAGNKDGLADKVAEKYGISKDEATKQVTEAFSKNADGIVHSEGVINIADRLR